MAAGLDTVEVANDAGFSGSTTYAYATSLSWTLAAGADGTRTVYARFKDKAGNLSAAASDGITLDADYVFDVRMLPNPHYEPELKPLTGRDQPVIDFLARQPAVQLMQEQIATFLRTWLPALAHDHRSYVTVAIGCTGGQHRSVYLVEQLAAQFGQDWQTLRRHRELDGL